MTAFHHLIRFEAAEEEGIFFADLGPGADGPPRIGESIAAYSTIGDLLDKRDSKTAVIQRLLAPLPRDDIPIYCVGLNYYSHAKEARLTIPSYPPLWTKPTAALAQPNEDIQVNDFCAQSLLDYEGELVVVTSKECKDITENEAKDYILGYTVGNDISCRKFQRQSNSGGQFFYAKAFDKFAPIGPTLISPEAFAALPSAQVVTKVNGQIRQTADLKNDMIFSPAKILSHMSQGTTIPAGTAIMTGTAAGVGVFLQPAAFLNHGDIVEISMDKVGTLRNKFHFQYAKPKAEP